MPDDEPVDQPEPSAADRAAFELFKRAVLEGPRARGPILAELNNRLRPHRLALVMMAGTKHS